MQLENNQNNADIQPTLSNIDQQIGDRTKQIEGFFTSKRKGQSLTKSWGFDTLFGFEAFFSNQKLFKNTILDTINTIQQFQQINDMMPHQIKSLLIKALDQFADSQNMNLTIQVITKKKIKQNLDSAIQILNQDIDNNIVQSNISQLQTIRNDLPDDIQILRPYISYSSNTKYIGRRQGIREYINLNNNIHQNDMTHIRTFINYFCKDVKDSHQQLQQDLRYIDNIVQKNNAQIKQFIQKFSNLFTSLRINDFQRIILNKQTLESVNKVIKTRQHDIKLNLFINRHQQLLESMQDVFPQTDNPNYQDLMKRFFIDGIEQIRCDNYKHKFQDNKFCSSLQVKKLIIGLDFKIFACHVLLDLLGQILNQNKGILTSNPFDIMNNFYTLLPFDIQFMVLVSVQFRNIQNQQRLQIFTQNSIQQKSEQWQHEQIFNSFYSYTKRHVESDNGTNSSLMNTILFKSLSDDVPELVDIFKQWKCLRSEDYIKIIQSAIKKVQDKLDKLQQDQQNQIQKLEYEFCNGMIKKIYIQQLNKDNVQDNIIEEILDLFDQIEDMSNHPSMIVFDTSSITVKNLLSQSEIKELKQLDIQSFNLSPLLVIVAPELNENSKQGYLGMINIWKSKLKWDFDYKSNYYPQHDKFNNYLQLELNYYDREQQEIQSTFDYMQQKKFDKQSTIGKNKRIQINIRKWLNLTKNNYKKY